MRFALYGYGKMGKAIESEAVARGHELALRVTAANAGTPPHQVDVAIEFSKPDQALANMRLCLEMGVPVVVGTTGWYDKLPEVRRLVDEYQGALLWASNFSIGVNLFFRVNRQLAALMDKQPDYAAHIDEVHHVHKLDAPSGTAITLANDIDLRSSRYSGWELATGHGHREPALPIGRQNEAVLPAPLAISSERIGEIPGKHSVTWASANDRITITHEAFNRKGFALGAVIAAEWLQNRKGMFTMDDLLET
jgi:4-hydroxy-tetrahydrodipicolinate reductase